MQAHEVIQLNIYLFFMMDLKDLETIPLIFITS